MNESVDGVGRRAGGKACFPFLSALLLAALAASVFGLWAGWEPWAPAHAPREAGEGRLRFLGLSADGRSTVALHWAGREGTEEMHLGIQDCLSLRQRIRLEGCEGIPEKACFSDDGRRVLLVSREDEIQTFDATSGKKLCRYRGHVEGHPPPKDGNYLSPLHACLSPGGVRAASWYEGGPRRGVRIWETGTGRDLLLLDDHGGDADAVEWSRDGSCLAARLFDGHVAVWDVQGGVRILTFGAKGATGGDVVSFRFGPGGLRVLVRELGEDSERLRVVDAGAAKEISVLADATLAVESARFSPDGSRIAALCRDMPPGIWELMWWDAETGRRLGREPLSHGTPLAMLFSRDGRRLATVDGGGAFRVRDADTGAALARIDLGAGDVRAYALVSDDVNAMAYYEGSWFGNQSLWVRRRPEQWWGAFRLPGLHVSFGLAIAFAWALRRDARRWSRR